MLNDPGPLNIIVYFTDGRSTAIPAQFDVAVSPSSPGCTYSPIDGVIMTSQSAGSVWGLFQQQAGPAPTPNPDFVLHPDCSGLIGSGSNVELLVLPPYRDNWEPLGPGNPPAISIYNATVNRGLTRT